MSLGPDLTKQFAGLCDLAETLPGKTPQKRAKVLYYLACAYMEAVESEEAAKAAKQGDGGTGDANAK